MSRVRTIYQPQNVFCGHFPSSGLHSIDLNGNFNNNLPATDNYNLIQPLSRIQSFSYQANIDKTQIKQLGNRGLVHRSIINPGSVSIDFNYLQHGLSNEHKIGLNVNYLVEYGALSGRSFYEDNFGVCLISGLIDRTFTREQNQIQYPFFCLDKKNLFLGIEDEGSDLNINYYSPIHPRAQYLTTYAFGDCFLDSYKATAEVGNFPFCTVSWIADNIEISNSGSGISNPALDTKTRQPISNGGNCFLPSTFIGSGVPSVLLPGDITLDFTCLPQLTNINIFNGSGVSGSLYPDIYDIGASFNDIKIQSYNIDLPLPRVDLQSLGWKLPVDRQINFPVIATMGVNSIVGNFNTGSFVHYLNKNDDYNISVKYRQPPTNKIAVQYDMKRAKLDSFSFSDAIGSNKSLNMVFSTEIDPDNNSKGLFVSGLLNQDQALLTLTNFLLKEDGAYLLKEDGGRIIIENAPLLF